MSSGTDYTLEDSVYLLFTTRAFATGIPGTLSAATCAVYEDVTATPILTSVAVTESLNSIAGLNAVTIAATAANGFNVGGAYHVVLEAGTVDSVSAVGEVVGNFTVGHSAAAVDLANGTDGLGAIKAETALIVADTSELQADDTPSALAAISGKIDTAQADLDIVTGASGVNLLTATQASIDAIEVDTGTTLQNELDGIQADTEDIQTQIGTAGAGLTAVAWNAAWDAEVESEVNDALDTAISELGVAAPAATPTIRTALMLLYMALRNKTVVQTSGTDAIEIYNNAGTKIAAKAIADDGSDYTESEMA